MLKQSIAWRVRQFAAISKHPSLLLSAYKGIPEVARLLTEMELSDASLLWASGPNDDVEATVKLFRRRLWYSASVLYALCRRFQPDIVVETGVRNGASTAFVLQALDDNRKGHLYSIDLPNVTYRRADFRKEETSDLVLGGKPTGFMVPESLRSRWTLIIGDAKKELPILMENFETIDLFHHDSLHTYEHMYFEFQTAWPKLRSGGILASDDVNSNSAFQDFCKAKDVVARTCDRTGFAVKS